MENQLHQVETTRLMSVPITVPEDTGRSFGRRSLRCLAVAMTAAGGAIIYFGSRYFDGFWRAGSQSRSAEWMQDLPSGERKISQSLMRVVQKSSADSRSDHSNFKPADSGDMLIVGLQLATAMLGSSSLPVPQIAGSSRDVGPANAGSDRTTLPMASVVSLADEPRVEKRTLWESVHGHQHDLGDADISVRKKKNIGEMEEITTENLAHHVDSMLEKEKVPEAIRGRFLYRISIHQNGQLPVFVVQSLIKDVIVILKGLARIPDPDATERNDYHALYFGLRMLWKFTRVFHDELSRSKLDQYKEALQQEYWLERKQYRMLEERPAQLDEQAIIDYLASRSPRWRTQRLTGLDNIVFHSSQETRMFSIAEVLEYRHMDFLKEASDSGLYFHLQYDNTGLRDPDLVSLVRSAANRQLFINFKQAPRYQPEGYYKIAAEQLVELHLQQITSTPLHFDYVTAIERLIERAAEKFLPNRPLDRSTQETLAAVRSLAVVQLSLNLTEKIVYAYACGYVLAGEDALFGDLDKQQILDSDYIYRYRDDAGKTHSAITTLDVFLCRGAKGVSSDIGKRDGVRMLWPEQFSAALIAYLNDGDAMVNTFARKVAAEVRLIDLERSLGLVLPSLSGLLQGYIEEVGQVYGIKDCNLSDQVEFTYRETVPLLFGQRETAGDNVKNMTIMQILIGDERSWKLVDVPLHVRRITNIPSTVPVKKVEDYKNYIRSLLVFNVQERLSSMFADLKQRTDAKAWFHEYVAIVTADFQVEGVPMYEFSDTPLLQIFPVRNPDRQEWEAGRRRSNPYGNTEGNAWLKESEIPFHLVSLVSRKSYYFKSFADMMKLLSSDLAFAAHLKAHFSVGYASGFTDPDVTEIHTKDNLYERRIDWTLNNFDRIIKSTGEMILFSVIEGAGSIGFIFGEMLSLIHPKLGFMLSAASVSGSKMLQGILVATRPDEQKRLIKEAILGLLDEMANKVVGQMGGVYKDKMPEEKMESIDQTVKQSLESILGRYFSNTTSDWK